MFGLLSICVAFRWDFPLSRDFSRDSLSMSVYDFTCSRDALFFVLLTVLQHRPLLYIIHTVQRPWNLRGNSFMRIRARKETPMTRISGTRSSIGCIIFKFMEMFWHPPDDGGSLAIPRSSPLSPKSTSNHWQNTIISRTSEFVFYVLCIDTAWIVR